MDSSVVGFAAIIGAFFAIANPFSGIPFFLGYSSPLSSAREKFLAAIMTTVTLWVGATVVLFAGKAVLDFFGVSIDGLRVGGGLVILLSGLSMMNTNVEAVKKSGRSLSQVVHDLVRRGHSPKAAAKSVHASSDDAAAALNTHAKAGGTDPVSVAVIEAAATSQTPSDAKPVAPVKVDSEQVKKNKRAAYLSLMFPFAIPMVLGPGFMSTILIAENSNGPWLVMGGYSIILGITLLVFLLATPIRALLGSFGMNVLLRLVGLIVIILAFEIMAAGLVKLLPGLAG